MHPYLLHFGHLYLPTFGVLAAVGLMAALLLSQRTAVLVGVDPDTLWNAGLFAILSAYLLSRLLLLVAHWSMFRAFPWLLLAVPSITPAGVVLTAAATLVWMRVVRLPELKALDAWAPCVACAWMFVAMGQLAAGTDAGRPGSGLLRHPAGYAAISAAALAVLGYQRLKRRRRDGETAGATLVIGGLIAFLLMMLRLPGTAAWLGLEPSQWLSLAAVAAGGCLVAFAAEPA